MRRRLLLALALPLVLVAWRAPHLYRACAEYAQRRYDAQWRRDRCRTDPEFRAHMRSMCEEEAEAALPAVAPFALGLLRDELAAIPWAWAVPGGLLLLLAFGLPVCRACWERAEHRRLLRACSPDLRTARPFFPMRRRAAIRAYAASSPPEPPII